MNSCNFTATLSKGCELIADTAQWRHDEHDGVSNHQPHDCLLNCLFGHRSKKTSKVRVTGLCADNSPVTGELPAQMASNNAENVSIWWRHHALIGYQDGDRNNNHTAATWNVRGRFKNAYELLNLRALKISMLYKNHIFLCMGMIFCVEFQRVPLQFHTKYLIHTLKDADFIHRWKFKSSEI